MKARLNITIDENLLASMKDYVQEKDTSISEIVEDYFKQITKTAPRKTIVEHIRKRARLKAGFDVNADLVDLYYKENAKKHGF